MWKEYRRQLIGHLYSIVATATTHLAHYHSSHHHHLLPRRLTFNTTSATHPNNSPDPPPAGTGRPRHRADPAQLRRSMRRLHRRDGAAGAAVAGRHGEARHERDGA